MAKKDIKEVTVPIEKISGKIYLIRDQKVILDRDLADLYEVETKQLKRAVRRNIDRFPRDFMFELTKSELENWRYQFGTSKGFINSKGAVIAFQKNAWNSLRSEKDAEYSIDAAREARLKGNLKGHNDLALFCVPPTRLAGPCRRVLTQMFENC